MNEQSWEIRGTADGTFSGVRAYGVWHEQDGRLYAGDKTRFGIRDAVGHA
jgi:hypothetical protein